MMTEAPGATIVRKPLRGSPPGNKPLRIVIDDGLSTLGRLGGIGSQCLSLYDGLHRLSDCRLTRYEYLRYLPRPFRRLVYVPLANFRALVTDGDVMQYQNYYVPRFRGQALMVSTIHDLVAVRFPETLPLWYRYYSRKALTTSLRRSDLIITPSLSVKREIEAMHPDIEPMRVHMVPNALRDVFWASPVSPVPCHPVLDNVFFLFVGALELRKNLRLLIEGFIRARKLTKISSNTRLVLVGRKGFGWDEVERQVLNPENNIVMLGQVDDELLLGLYRKCRGLLFPSLYEGFGYPVVEAMSQSAPIVISDIPTNMELNVRHGNRMLVFSVDKQEEYISRLELLDSDQARGKLNLNYGDLTMYRRAAVAERYLEKYMSALTRRSAGSS
jgi:glycosyltransferase involved in cell wall biosynthesis